MSEPLLNCPLCDAVPEYDSLARWAWCGNRKCTFNTLAPAREPQWRALAAMRKPLTPDEADAMLRAHADAAEDLGALRRTCSQEDRHALVRRVDAAGDALRDALTGKR